MKTNPVKKKQQVKRSSYFIYLFLFLFCKIKGWDFCLFSGHPTAFCILTNKDLF